MIGKELEHHGPSLIGAYLLLAVALIVSLAMELDQHVVTLLSATFGTVGYAEPMLAIFLAERLVVHDHDAGTHEFLSALPVPPLLRAIVRFSLGLAALLAVNLAMLLFTALVASRREGVPLIFLLTLALHLSIYLYAWFGVAFGIAHTGRYRWLLWWLLLTSTDLAANFSEQPWRNIYWFGLVADGIDRNRLAPPWSAVPLTALWGSAGLALGLFASSWRGGWLLERLFRPATAELRARLIGVGVAALVVSSAGSDREAGSSYRSLPGVERPRAIVRAAASEGADLWGAAASAADALESLGAEIGVERWPELVLLRAQQEDALPTAQRAPTGLSDPDCVLLVDASRPISEITTASVTQATACRLSGLADWAPDARWLTDGLAAWWIGVDEPAWALRARLALRRAEGAKDWLEVRERMGQDEASALSWAQLRAIEEISGRDAVLSLARRVLSPRYSASYPSGLRLRLLIRGDLLAREGIARESLRDPLERVLSAAQAAGDSSPLPQVRVEASEGELVARWQGELPPGTVLEWRSLDALQEAPLPSDRTERLIPPSASEELSLRADVRLRAAARLLRRDPELGLVSSPWGVGP